MLQKLFQTACAASLLLTFKDQDHNESVRLTPSFDDAGLLAGLTVEVLPPVNDAAPVPQEPQQQAHASPPPAEERPVAAAATDGATELDPVTGAVIAKRSEQV